MGLTGELVGVAAGGTCVGVSVGGTGVADGTGVSVGGMAVGMLVMALGLPAEAQAVIANIMKHKTKNKDNFLNIFPLSFHSQAR